MRRNTRLPELLAPAGDFEALLAAVSAGADASSSSAARSAIASASERTVVQPGGAGKLVST